MSQIRFPPLLFIINYLFLKAYQKSILFGRMESKTGIAYRLDYSWACFRVIFVTVAQVGNLLSGPKMSDNQHSPAYQFGLYIFTVIPSFLLLSAFIL